MSTTWFTSTFLNFLKFPQIKEGDLISWVEPNSQNGWIIWSYLLYFISRNLRVSNSSSFIRFKWVLHDSPVLFSIFWNFLKLKRGDLISWVEATLPNGWIIWSYLLYFNSRNLKDSNSLSFIRFKWVLHDSPVLFSICWNFLKLKRGDLISWVEPTLENGWIIWFPILYFNSRNFKDSNSSSFIRFQ